MSKDKIIRPKVELLSAGDTAMRKPRGRGVQAFGFVDRWAPLFKGMPMAAMVKMMCESGYGEVRVWGTIFGSRMESHTSNFRTSKLSFEEIEGYPAIVCTVEASLQLDTVKRWQLSNNSPDANVPVVCYGVLTKEVWVEQGSLLHLDLFIERPETLKLSPANEEMRDEKRIDFRVTDETPDRATSVVDGLTGESLLADPDGLPDDGGDG